VYSVRRVKAQLEMLCQNEQDCIVEWLWLNFPEWMCRKPALLL
jgi:hypothetical protein